MTIESVLISSGRNLTDFSVPIIGRAHHAGATAMTADGIDMAKVRDVLRSAVKPVGSHSQRGLAREAGLDRDVVYDLLQGRNRNPSLKVLAALAEAMGKDLSAFGIGTRVTAPSAEELHAV